MSLRVFLSSTGADLADHRLAVERLLIDRGWTVVAMERFGADPRSNLAMCLDKVEGSDAVVVVVAHRYGSPVPTSEGGDGEHSYTWFELEHAETKKRDVFGYLARDDGWHGPREGDGLASAEDEAAVQRLFRRAKLLKELKERLRSRPYREFLTPDQLAGAVVTDLSRWNDERPGAPSRAVASGPPRIDTHPTSWSAERDRNCAVRFVIEVEIDPHDLAAVVGIFTDVRALAPDVEMRFLGAGRGSFWIEVGMDRHAAQDLSLRWKRGELHLVGGRPLSGITAGSLSLASPLPPLPRKLTVELLQTWLKLALPNELPDLAGSFLDRALAGPAPVLAMHTGEPPPQGTADGALPLALLMALAERDPSWPYLPDDAAALLLPTRLDLSAMQISTRDGVLAVVVPPRADAPETPAVLRGLLDADTLAKVEARCAHGLRLLVPLPNAEHRPPRLWVRRGGAVQVHDGFLVVPEDPALAGMIETSELTRAPWQVLLGEPGMGKSTELRRLADALWVQHPADAVHLVDLRSVGSHDDLRQRLAELPVDDGTGSWNWILVDSLDECLLRVNTLADQLVEALERWGTERLRLRICCRSGAWPPSLDHRLAELWRPQADDADRVVELLPLRREDVAKCVTVDPQRFLDAVAQARVGALAARPITLEMLLGAFDGRGLPRSRSALYDLGIRRLAQEWSDRRKEAAPDPTRLRRRMAAAGRMATVLLLGGRTHVTLGAEASDAPGAVSLDEQVGLERDNSGTWSMDEAVLDDVLRGSALFSTVGVDGRSFEHHSFAEYLAAWHLIAHGFTGSLALRLLWPEGAAEVAPQLHGLAAWLAALDPSTRDALARTDREVLLHTDPAMLTDEVRAGLVERILAARAAGEEGDDVRTDEFRGLMHPGLQAQLLPALEPQPELEPTRALVLRRTAVHIARQTGLRTICPRLLDLALDPGEPMPLRFAAAHAARALDPDLEHVDAWTRLARGHAGPDPDHDLRGTALQALWPRRRDRVPLREVLAVQPRRNYFGAMAGFLAYTLPDHLEVGDLPDLLEVSAELWDGRASWTGIKLWEAVYDLAWRSFEQWPRVRDALVDAAYRLRSKHLDLPLDAAAIAASAVRRHRFIEAVLADPRCEESTLWMMAMGPPALLRPIDLAWAIEQYRAEHSKLLLANYHSAIRLCFDSNDPAHLDLLFAACDDLPALKDWWRLSLLGPIALDSEEATRMRQQHARLHRPEPPLLDPPPAERVQERLGDCEADPAWFPCLLDQLTLKARSTRYESPYQQDLRRLAGWQAADLPTRSRILDCATRFLDATDPEPATWFGSNNLPAPALAGLHGALLLQAERPSALDEASWWERWGATFVELSGAFSGEATSALVRRAVRQAPAATCEGLRLRLDQASSDTDYESALQHTDAAWSPEIAALVRAEVDRAELSVERRSAALSQWLRHEAGSLDALIAVEGNTSLPVPLRARAAIRRFHSHGASLPADWWTELARDEELASAVARGLNDWRIHHEGAKRDQPATVLASLYRWLCAHRDPDAGAWTDSDLAVATTPADWQEELRGRLPQWLAHRAEPEDIEALEGLVRAHPTLVWVLDEARNNRLRKTWRPRSPREVVALLFKGPEPDLAPLRR